MKLKPIIPFEPISVKDIPSGDEWIYQIKWDGVRILTYFDGKEIQLFNRKLNERTFHFPELTRIHDYFTGESVILDGEVIALDENGKPSFHEVMRRDALRKMDRVKQVQGEVSIYYMIFDIIFYNGKWLTDHPLHERLEILNKCVKPNPTIQLVPTQKQGHALWNVVLEHGLEGIICKNIDSTYTIKGKDKRWQKVKNYQDIIAVIAGVTYRNEIVNSVLLGLYDPNGNLWYIGHCGTGKMTQSDWKDLTTQTDSLKTNERPFLNEPERIKDVQWILPNITVKVQYIEWTEGRSLRQPSIQAITNIPASECHFPNRSNKNSGTKEHPMNAQRSVNPLEREITHPDKPIWKNPSINKKQYMEYLYNIYPYISPFLHDRLLTVIRYPHGMFGERFFQKNCPNYAPSFIETVESEGINYILCNNLETFLWLGNQLALEFHIPFQTIKDKECPSEIVFDLDPPSKDAFSLAIKAAQMIKEALDNLKLISFVKTSGNKGLQIYIPLPKLRYTFDDTRLFTSFISKYLISKAPDSFTTERMKNKRHNRLYVDYVQHAKGKTIISPFSPRGNPKATVAAPLFWEEVHTDLTMDMFQIPTMLQRLKDQGNPFESFSKVKEEQNFEPILQFLKNQKNEDRLL